MRKWRLLFRRDRSNSGRYARYSDPGNPGLYPGFAKPAPVLDYWSWVGWVLEGVNFEAVDSANPVAMASRIRVISR